MTCRILYLVAQLGMGGLERQLSYLLQTIDRERYQPTVVVWNYNKEDLFAKKISKLGVSLYSLPSKLSSVGKLKAFRDLVRVCCPEIVHSYSFYTNFAVWFASLGTPAIPIGSIRQNFVSERQKAGNVLGRLSARWPATQICNSEAAKATIEKMQGCSKPKDVFIVRNRLDLHDFPFYPVPNGPPHLLAVGRLYPEKRWDRLLKSLAVIASRGLKFSLYHAGEGPLRARLESMARELGIEAFVRFIGLRHDIPALLKNATFLVHTSDDEGCPNVVMEAMACGRAVVATDAGDVPYLVEDGKTGFLVRRGDDDTLIESMEKLISDYDLACGMGEAGREKAEQAFGLNHLALETLAVYRTAGWGEN
jgi:glycosyltransferase involved in cell wall biosynthesis